MKIKSQRLGSSDFPSSFDVVRSATLNKTDLTGGNNKFYQIESHVSKDGKEFRLYSCYGRVGAKGVEEERIPESQDSDSLDRAFDFLVKAKTSKRKGYVEVKMASTKVGSNEGNKKILSEDIKQEKIIAAKGKVKPADKLEPSVAKLVDRLYSEAGKAVRSQLSGSLQTTAENPLGTLTLTQIESGREVLQRIQKLLTKSPSYQDSIKTKILDLSNEFYSAIPQVMAKRPTKKAGKPEMDKWLQGLALNNSMVIDEKEDLLELLSDVQGMVGGFAATDAQKRYSEIGCVYEALTRSDDRFKRVEKHIKGTRSRHHSWGARIENIWTMSVKGQKKEHVPGMKKAGNIKPMFHGSRNANILGICKHGLLMRPPGVYITGSMFGNGLYFADQSSKSEQYSTSRFGGSRRGADTYFLFVADVALGKVKKYTSAQTHLSRPPSGFNSVQGAKGSYLLHNEFIIYKLNQHILQYLIEFKPTGSRW